MNILIEKENGMVTARLEGRLDTPASLEVAPQMESLQADADKTIVLDCEKLEYISSSGLRLFLSLRKAAVNKGGNVIVRGISNEIRQVFIMTGFLNLFQIED
ncbi:MAG: STAS domain-containing protein [Bacteroidales bacterium]|jgi:anti-sigma B factor antagonist|nr:STAS domain-containing protein [Bacteroidales bacterium]